MTSDYRPLFPVDPTGLDDIARRLLEPASPVPPVSSGRILILDDMAADGGKTRTQDQWFEYWKEIMDRRFASAADMYTVFKQLKAASTGTAPQKQQASTLLTSLREDWGGSNWQLTSTRIIYEKTGLNAKIIHGYGRTGVTPLEVSLEVPEWLDVPIMDVLKDRRGLPYLQAYFGTRDSAETIVATLEYASQKSKPNIKIWTSPLKHDTYAIRKDYPERAAGFFLRSVVFHVIGDDRVVGSGGRSRGVRP